MAAPMRVEAFRTALQEMFREAEAKGLTSISITSRLLSERVGKSVRGAYDEMMAASRVLRLDTRETDVLVYSPPKSHGNRYQVVFTLPRLPQATPAAASAAAATLPAQPDQVYFEGKRIIRELAVFARSPQLVAAAKAAQGHLCKACGFDFQARYGNVGVGFIECHHIDPISGRGGVNKPTAIQEVVMLCANCHRMIHRKPGAMTLGELRSAISQQSELASTE